MHTPAAMSQTIVLPRADGTCMPYTAGRRAPLSPSARRFSSRIAYAAAHVVCDEPFPWSLREGAKGVQLAELGLRSWRERRWLDVPDLTV